MKTSPENNWARRSFWHCFILFFILLILAFLTAVHIWRDWKTGQPIDLLDCLHLVAISSGMVLSLLLAKLMRSEEGVDPLPSDMRVRAHECLASVHDLFVDFAARIQGVLSLEREGKPHRGVTVPGPDGIVRTMWITPVPTDEGVGGGSLRFSLGIGAWKDEHHQRCLWEKSIAELNDLHASREAIRTLMETSWKRIEEIKEKDLALCFPVDYPKREWNAR